MDLFDRRFSKVFADSYPTERQPCLRSLSQTSEASCDYKNRRQPGKVLAAGVKKSERDARRGLRFAVSLELRTLLESEHSGPDAAGEAAHHQVIGRHLLNEASALGGDAVFSALELSLQVEKLLIGL